MKILLVTESLGSGGAERQLVGLATQLKQAGADVKVVTWGVQDFHAQTLANEDIEWLKIPSSKIKRVWHLAKLYRTFRPDAVISYLPMANQTAILARLISPIKNLIVSERSFTSDWGWHTRFVFTLYRLADHVVANSEHEAENIRRHCSVLNHKTISIPNMVDIDKFYPSEGKIADVYTPVKLVGVGRVIESKNLMRLADALAKIKTEGLSFTMQWYGSIYDKTYVGKLKKHITSLHIDDCFTLMSECHDMASVYRNADAFVMPSLIEGYPNVLVEAMASGLPVACSAVCEHPKIVEPGLNGFLFNPQNVTEIANAIKAMLNLKKRQRETIAIANRCKVVENNSPDAFRNRYFDLIDQSSL